MGGDKKGALPSQTLEELIRAGFIKGSHAENISPASLDLSLSAELYEIKGLLLPRRGDTIRDLLPLMEAVPHDISAPLAQGHMYLARLNESLELPSQVYGYCNPKSSTGRLDMHVRVLADGVPRYDSVTPKGFTGELWAAIHPKSFAIAVHEGTPLTQLRLFTGDTRLSELELEVAVKEHKLVWHETEDRPLTYPELLTHDQDGALILTAMIGKGVCGYVCTTSPDQVLDVKNVGGYKAEEFFAPVYAEDGVLKLERDKFYILSGAERVRIPPTLASEMVPMDERSGDFRSHYAGFLDPGWGWGSDGTAHGRPFTLEVRPFEDLVVRKDQPIAKIKFEKMAAEPSIHYDTKQSNYLQQSGPKLGKQFK
ncbi:MAG: 2'-deoxycytidine 5'-triphosphate deaminase [Candidatus Paceibacterota bacterium]